MTLQDEISRIVLEMVRSAGPLAWTNPETGAAIANAAKAIVEQLYGPLGPDDMATQAIYRRSGQAITFQETAGANIVGLTAKNVNSAAGWQSALFDQDGGAWGAARRPDFWEYRAVVQAAATPTAGLILDWRLNTSDGTNIDSGASADATVSALALLSNCKPLIPTIVTAAAANTPFVSWGHIVIPARYFGVAFWNLMGSATRNTADTTKIVFTPWWADVGAAA